MKAYIDHIVISTLNFKKSVRFYSSFLGKPKITEWDASWKIGEVKLFLTFPYKKKPKLFDKHNIGLNHIAFGIPTLKELQRVGSLINKAGIKNSGIQTDKFGKNKFIWFDDPDNIRLEFYCREKFSK